MSIVLSLYLYVGCMFWWAIVFPKISNCKKIIIISTNFLYCTSTLLHYYSKREQIFSTLSVFVNFAIMKHYAEINTCVGDSMSCVLRVFTLNYSPKFSIYSQNQECYIAERKGIWCTFW